MRVRLLSLFALAVLTAGCNSVIPTTSYVGAHRKTHSAYKGIVDTFSKDHPEDAQVAQDLYNSEERLITNAENGIYPTPPLGGSVLPPGTVVVPAAPQRSASVPSSQAPVFVPAQPAPNLTPAPEPGVAKAAEASVTPSVPPEFTDNPRPE